MRRPALFLISFVFMSLMIGFNLYVSFHRFHELVYPLDDAYIHMAISKNLAQHGVWGVTKFQFSSTSSSILYTLLLAGSFAVLGVHVWIPLILNWIVAALVLWLLSGISLRFFIGWRAVVFNLAFVALVPLSGMAVLGMEHTLQIFFCTLLLWQSFKKWNGEKVNDLLYGLTALLAVASRYESVFLIALIGMVWLFLFRNIRQTVLLAIAAILPVLIFGLYALSRGGFFVPNSLLAKSNYVNGGLFGFLTEVSKKIIFNSLLASLLSIPLVYFLFNPIQRWQELKTRPAFLVTLIVAGTAILHQVFASFGWMFRYEAYLIALVFLGFAVGWQELRLPLLNRGSFARGILVISALILLLPILSRIQIPDFSNRASKNIHDQQLQMARFVQAHFPNAGVAMNDIGTTTFTNDNIRLFDMEGLATIEILKMKKQFDSTFLENYVREHHIDIGIFYPQLYSGKIPAGWERVGTWEIKDRFVSAGSLVGFYVINPAVRDSMINGLRNYSGQLPKDVVQGGRYTEAGL